MDKSLYERQISEFNNVEIERLREENKRLMGALKEINMYCPDSEMKPEFVMAFLEKVWTISHKALGGK